MTPFSIPHTVPGLPELNRLCTVLIWKPPTEPAGVITGYELRFGETILSFGPDENFYITSGDQRAQNALVEVSNRMISWSKDGSDVVSY